MRTHCYRCHSTNAYTYRFLYILVFVRTFCMRSLCATNCVVVNGGACSCATCLWNSLRHATELMALHKSRHTSYPLRLYWKRLKACHIIYYTCILTHPKSCMQRMTMVMVLVYCNISRNAKSTLKVEKNTQYFGWSFYIACRLSGAF